MLKKSIYFLLFTLILSGCVERGQNLTPKHITKYEISIEDEKINPSRYVLKVDANKSKIDTTQNNIAGTLLLVIGLIIIL